MATVTASYNWVSGETVTPAKLNSAAAPTVVVADNEVTTAKILDANVTAGKLAATLDLSGKTVTLPDDSVTDAKLSLAANAGEIKKAINADNDPPIFACRAWVNFNGQAGATVDGEFRCTIRAQGNVSKVVRVATGNYVIFFATAMPDSNYCIISSGNDDAADTTFRGTNNIGQNSLTSQCQVLHKGVNSAAQVLENSAHIQVAIFR
jgi:hypothetical protein